MILPLIGSTLRRGARMAAERPRLALWTLVALTCALFAAAAAVTTAENVAQWSAGPRGDGGMVVYLGEGIDTARATKLASELRALSGVDRVEVVPPAETARRLTQALGGDTALLDGVDAASLPASIEVTFAPGVRDVIALSPTVRALRSTPGIDDVVLTDATGDHVASALAAVRAIAWAIAALACGLAVLVVLAALRDRLERDRHELATLRLLGASPSFTIAPSAFAGAAQGALAALAALGVLEGALAMWGPDVVHARRGAAGHVALAGPSLAAGALFVALGAALGCLGGGLAGASRAR